MKNLTYIFFMLFSIVTFSQENKKTIKSKDTYKAVNIILDSLSKVYKKEVVFFVLFKEMVEKKPQLPITIKIKILNVK